MGDLIHTSAGLFVTAFASIFSIANPLAVMPIFTTLTFGKPAAKQKSIARQAAIYMMCILALFLFAGGLITTFFGISLAGIRVAGGLIIMQSAWAMLKTQDTSKKVSEDTETSGKDKDSIAFTPLAMPLLAGPGGIAVVIGLSSASRSVLDLGIISVAVVFAAVGCYAIMRLGPFTSRLLGAAGMDAVSKMMGLIVMAISIQFILSGIQDFFGL